MTQSAARHDRSRERKTAPERNKSARVWECHKAPGGHLASDPASPLQMGEGGAAAATGGRQGATQSRGSAGAAVGTLMSTLAGDEKQSETLLKRSPWFNTICFWFGGLVCTTIEVRRKSVTDE